MSWVQRLITGLLPRKWAAAIEADSRAWVMTCQTCGYETSVWDAGGIRFAAAGHPVRRFRCPNCGPTAHRLHKRPTPPATSTP